MFHLQQGQLEELVVGVGSGLFSLQQSILRYWIPDPILSGSISPKYKKNKLQMYN